MPQSYTATNSTVVTALIALLRHPVDTFITSWNWKAATLSVLLRAPVFLIATLRHGRAAIETAVLVESLYSAAISGCYGAFTQRLRRAQPLWLSALLLTLIAPAFLLWLDYLLHRWSGMPNLRNGILAAGIFASLSSLFNWFVMWHGTLLTGREGATFSTDLKRLPRLLLGFLTFIPRYLLRTTTTP